MDGDVLHDLRGVLAGFDELAEQWGDESKFHRMRERLRAIIKTEDCKRTAIPSGEWLEFVGFTPTETTNRYQYSTSGVSLVMRINANGTDCALCYGEKGWLGFVGDFTAREVLDMMRVIDGCKRRLKDGGE